MIEFKQYLNEHYVNLIGNDPKKKQYAHELYAMLQKSYEKAGGLIQGGFRSPEDMIKNVPMWKLVTKSGKLVAAVLYKDKDGRKSVAMCTDGTEEGKAAATQIMKDDLGRGRSYAEKSSVALSFTKKKFGSDELLKHAIPYSQVDKHLDADDEVRRPPEDDPEILRHPEFKDYFYQRKIGGHWHTKMMMGHPGKKIT